MGIAPAGRQMTNVVIVILRISGVMGTLGARLRRQRVEQEMWVARSIQQASLPKEFATLEDWQITPYYQPTREVGGDFYDFFELDDGRVGFACHLADLGTLAGGLPI